MTLEKAIEILELNVPFSHSPEASQIKEAIEIVKFALEQKNIEIHLEEAFLKECECEIENADVQQLKPCPFCGGTKLKVECKSVLDGYIEDISRVERMTFSVRCNSCHARGGTASGRVIESFRLTMTEKDLPEWAISDTKLKEKAIEAWNRRADDERKTD